MNEKDLRQQLELQFTKEQIMNWFILPVKTFLTNHLNTNWGNVTGADIAETLGKAPTKAAAINAASMFYSRDKILLDFYNTLGEKDKALLQKIVWQGKVLTDEFTEIYGTPMLIERTLQRNTFYTRDEKEYKFNPVIQFWHHFYSTNNNYYFGFSENTMGDFIRRRGPAISFHPLLQKIWANVLPKPAGYEFQGIELDNSLTVFNAEESIFSELQLLLTYYFQDNIKYSQKGNPNKANMRKTERLLHLLSFPGDDEKYLRSQMLAGLLYEGMNKKDMNMPLHLRVKSLFEKNYSFYPVPVFTLSYIKGFNYFYSNDFAENVTSDIISVFKELPKSSWLSFENLKTYIATRFINIYPFRYESQPDRGNLFYENGKESVALHRNNVPAYINTPLLASHVYLFAAFGLMEIAENLKKKNKFSIYDKLAAFRLTTLGEYVLGLTNTYEAPKIASAVEFVLSEDSLHLKVSGNTDMGMAMLKNYAQPTKGNLLQLNPEIFLKDCDREGDIKNKIALFKQVVQKPLPANWEKFFRNLLINSRTIKRHHNFMVVQLPNDDRALHGLIAQDVVLKKIVIKAEMFFVIIDTKNLHIFKNRLKALGYLINE